MSEYWKKLQDPRWQRRRLEVLQRADFSCEQCGSKTDTLHAHHKIYRKGHDPWEYEDRELACLCDNCHEIWHCLKDVINELLVDLDEAGIRAVCGYGQAVGMESGRISEARIASAFATRGFAHRFGVSELDVNSIKDEEMLIMANDVPELTAKKRRKRK